MHHSIFEQVFIAFHDLQKVVDNLMFGKSHPVFKNHSFQVSLVAELLNHVDSHIIIIARNLLSIKDLDNIDMLEFR